MLEVGSWKLEVGITLSRLRRDQPGDMPRPNTPALLFETQAF